MRQGDRVVVVMPAFNAARTLERIHGDIPREVVDEVIVVDDGSADETVAIASRLPVTVLRHERNRGYGATQKTCYQAALERDAAWVVMLHADAQYDARMIGPAVHILRLGTCDVVLGNRIRTRHEALAHGMPWVKYFANRSLTLLENMLSGQNLGEWHSGFRAYSRRVLETVPYLENSDDFVFDSQLLVQCVHFGLRIGDVPVPVRYFEEASSISLRDSTRYAVRTLRTFAGWYAHRFGLADLPRYRARRPPAAVERSPQHPPADGTPERSLDTPPDGG